jgi:endoribonuclease Dicer
MKWTEEIRNHQVLVFVHQVFLDLLLRFGDLIGFDRLNLLIVDEIHHTSKNHPYMQIFKEYKLFAERQPSNEHHPRILGLTASVVVKNRNKQDFMKDKEALEKASFCKIISTTENLADVLRYINMSFLCITLLIFPILGT